MPTIPLYDTSAPPDGYHRVIAPGGYEWWNVIAPGRITVNFHYGNPSDPAYRSAYRRYLANPTRVLPPLPQDYPSVSGALVDQGVNHTFDSRAATKASFRYVEHPPEVTIGASSIYWKSDRLLVIALGVTTAGQRGKLEGELSLDLNESAVEEDGAVCGKGRLTGVLRDAAKDVLYRIDDNAQYTHTFSVRPVWGR
jgi:hypothetical protein